MKAFSELYEVSEDGCWLWKAGKNARGRYGCLLVDGISVSAHRHSYALHKGCIPDGLFVCHRCDVTLCVNPNHLFLGTAKQNFDDMIAKGRGANGFLVKEEQGESNCNAKLSDVQVLEIRHLRRGGRHLPNHQGKVRNQEQWARSRHHHRQAVGSSPNLAGQFMQMRAQADAQ